MFRSKSFFCFLLTTLLLCFYAVSASATNIGSQFSEGLVGIKQNGKWGYMNKSGELVISPKWDSVTDFKNGYAIVRNKGIVRDKSTGTAMTEHYLYSYFLIDKSGKEIFTAPAVSATITVQNKYTFTLSHSSSLEWSVDANGNDIILVKKPTSWGLATRLWINVYSTVGQGYFYPETGKFIEFPNCETNQYTNNGISIYKTTNIKNQVRYGLKSYDGTTITEAIYQSIDPIDDVFIVENTTGKFGIINSSGSIIAKPQYDAIEIYKPGYFNTYGYSILLLRQEKKVGIILSNGQQITDLYYDDWDFYYHQGTLCCYGINNDSNTHDTYIVSRNGEVSVWSGIFAYPLNDGKYLFSTNKQSAYEKKGPFGVLDSTGDIIIPERCEISGFYLSSDLDDILISNEFGIAFTHTNESGYDYIFIAYNNPDQDVVYTTKTLLYAMTFNRTYDDAALAFFEEHPINQVSAYSDTLFICYNYRAHKYGLVNDQYEIVLPFEYDDYGSLSDGVSIWTMEDAWYLIDSNGNVIF